MKKNYILFLPIKPNQHYTFIYRHFIFAKLLKMHSFAEKAKNPFRDYLNNIFTF